MTTGEKVAAGMPLHPAGRRELAALIDAHLVLAEYAERERCAAVAEACYADENWNGMYVAAGETIAAAIRAEPVPTDNTPRC